MPALICISALSGLFDEQADDVHDVRAGGARDQQITQGFEKMVRIVAGRKSPGSRPRARARWQVVPSTKAPAASVGPSVPSVPALRRLIRRSLQGQGRGQGQFLVAAAFPLAFQGDGGLPPARRQAGGATG